MKLSSENDLLDAALESPECAPFAMFEIDLGAMRDPKSGSLLFPEFRGRHTPLWKITSNTMETTPLKEAQRLVEKQERGGRVLMMAQRVANSLTPFEGNVVPELDYLGYPIDDNPNGNTNGEDKPIDEWHHFWGGASPIEKGYVPR